MKFIHPVILASAMSMGSARAINEASFEGPVLEARQFDWKSADCYKSAGDLTLNGTDIYQSSGACRDVAQANNANVIALEGGDTCYYGNELPPSSDKVDSSQCSKPCQGFDKEPCGGDGAFLIWARGDVTAASGDSSSSSSSSSGDDTSSEEPSSSPTPTTTKAPTTPAPIVLSTVGGATITIVNAPENVNAAAATVSVTSSATPEPASGTNKGAIAAGVVVGVVGLAAIIGGAFLFLRSRKQRQDAADLHRQNSSSGFASRGEKPPSMYSITDSRLDPAFMRRMSDGSIADNQDYSRRILKVTNPDDR